MTDDDKALALIQLRAWLPPGAVVAGVSRHRSRSGNTRSISLFAQVGPDFMELDSPVSLALGLSLDRSHGGLRFQCSGPDDLALVALVGALSDAVFGKQVYSQLKHRWL